MSEQATATSDPTYDIVSVLYHALQGADTKERYIADARDAGDDDLADFLERAQQRDRDTAEDAKRVLSGRLPE